MDWKGVDPNFSLVPSFGRVKESVHLCRIRLTNPKVLQSFNRRLLVNGRQSGSACKAIPWDGIVPSVLHCDRADLLLFEWLVHNWDLSVPFPRWMMDVLCLINVCPVQLGANGWSHSRAFELKCDLDYVEPTVALFFYFFRVE